MLYYEIQFIVSDCKVCFINRVTAAVFMHFILIYHSYSCCNSFMSACFSVHSVADCYGLCGVLCWWISVFVSLVLISLHCILYDDLTYYPLCCFCFGTEIFLVCWVFLVFILHRCSISCLLALHNLPIKFAIEERTDRQTDELI